LENVAVLDIKSSLTQGRNRLWKKEPNFGTVWTPACPRNCSFGIVCTVLVLLCWEGILPEEALLERLKLCTKTCVHCTKAALDQDASILKSGFVLIKSEL
jgi:hypothetical protein